MEPCKEYDVGLSFSGKDRILAASLCAELTKLGVRVFYDEDYKTMLVGEHLPERLPEVYRDKCDVFVPLISGHYLESHWARTEKRAALDRALREEGFILPIRLDATPIPGISSGICYLDAQRDSLPELADVVATNLLGKRVLSSEGVHGAIRVSDYCTQIPVGLGPELHLSPLAQAHLDANCGAVLTQLLEAYGNEYASSASGEGREFPSRAKDILFEGGVDAPGYSMQFCFLDEEAVILAHPDLGSGTSLKNTRLPPEVKQFIAQRLSAACGSGPVQEPNGDARFFCWNDNMMSVRYPTVRPQRGRRNIGLIAPECPGASGSGWSPPPVFVFGEVHLM